MKNTVTAIDFGTSKIVALVGETSGRQRCDIIGAGFAGYAGFSDGQWNDPAQLNEAISKAVHEAEEQGHVRVREVSVGVPGEFSRVYTVETRLDLQGADPHVTERNIEDLFRNAVDELGLAAAQTLPAFRFRDPADEPAGTPAHRLELEFNEKGELIDAELDD